MCSYFTLLSSNRSFDFIRPPSHTVLDVWSMAKMTGLASARAKDVMCSRTSDDSSRLSSNDEVSALSIMKKAFASDCETPSHVVICIENKILFASVSYSRKATSKLVHEWLQQLFCNMHGTCHPEGNMSSKLSAIPSDAPAEAWTKSHRSFRSELWRGALHTLGRSIHNWDRADCSIPTIARHRASVLGTMLLNSQSAIAVTCP